MSCGNVHTFSSIRNVLSNRNRFITLLLPMLAAFFATALFAQGEYPEPRTPQLPKITTVEQLMPYARYYIQTPSGKSRYTPSIGARAGDKILLIVDQSIDPLVVEALTKAAHEAGAEFNMIVLEAMSREKDPVRLVTVFDPHELIPEWAWKAMEKSTIVCVGFTIGAHAMTLETRKWFREHKIKNDSFTYYTRELLAMSQYTYPNELYEAINYKVWNQIYGAKEIRITDPHGTDLVVPLDDGYWDRQWKDYQQAEGKELSPDEPVHWGHLQIGPMLSTKWQETHGTLAAIAMHADSIPLTKLTIQNGQVVKVEGEGTLADTTRTLISKYSDLRFPESLGPGVTYLVEITVAEQPKLARPANWKELQGEARYWAHSLSRQKAGVIHIAFGTVTTTICGLNVGCAGQDGHDFAKAHGTYMQHLDVELYAATYYADGKKVVDKGHLLALDDPEIRQLAAKYGDPNDLLKEIWIPNRMGE